MQKSTKNYYSKTELKYNKIIEEANIEKAQMLSLTRNEAEIKRTEILNKLKSAQKN